LLFIFKPGKPIMKFQTRSTPIFSAIFNLPKSALTGAVIIFCAIPLLSLSQAVTITSPVTNIAYKLADPATMQSAADVQAAITNAEKAGKDLSADVSAEKMITERERRNAAVNDKTRSDYDAALNHFAQYDVAVYNKDMANYTTSGTQYTDLLTKYNKAALANNALPAKDRKAATVVALNKQKIQIDAWAAKLGKWKTTLDAGKLKLDGKNADLQKRKQKYEAADQTTTGKLNASRAKLKGLLDQLTLCANYAGKCRGLLGSKFNVPNSPDTGYFSSAAYKDTIAGIMSALKR
jgi:hypothetical protein